MYDTLSDEVFTVGPVLIARIQIMRIQIVSFSRVRKLLSRKLILLIAHPYMQFTQMPLLNSQC